MRITSLLITTRMQKSSWTSATISIAALNSRFKSLATITRSTNASGIRREQSNLGTLSSAPRASARYNSSIHILSTRWFLVHTFSSKAQKSVSIFKSQKPEQIAANENSVFVLTWEVNGTLARSVLNHNWHRNVELKNVRCSIFSILWLGFLGFDALNLFALASHNFFHGSFFEITSRKVLDFSPSQSLQTVECTFCQNSDLIRVRTFPAILTLFHHFEMIF